MIYESRRASPAEAIAGELSKAPSCRRITFPLRHTVYVGLRETRRRRMSGGKPRAR